MAVPWVAAQVKDGQVLLATAKCLVVEAGQLPHRELSMNFEITIITLNNYFS